MKTIFSFLIYVVFMSSAYALPQCEGENVGLDNVRDHTDGARWLGNSLTLDLDFLKNA
jgi:aromatic ring-cleaving dioxygenase